jgi:hypothetical protein
MLETVALGNVVQAGTKMNPASIQLLIAPHDHMYGYHLSGEN